MSNHGLVADQIIATTHTYTQTFLYIDRVLLFTLNTENIKIKRKNKNTNEYEPTSVVVMLRHF